MDRAVSLGVGCLLGRVVGLCRENERSPWCHLVGIPNGSRSGSAELRKEPEFSFSQPEALMRALQRGCLPGISPGTSEHVLCYLSQPSEMWMDTGFLFLPK